MAIYATDTFTDADNTTLQAHTAGDGSTWTGHLQKTADVVFFNNEVYDKTAVTGQSGLYVNSATPQVDQAVTLTVHCLTHALNFGAILRTDHYVYYDAAASGGSWKMFLLGGSLFNATVDAGRFVAGNTYTVVFKEIGNTITVSVNGTQVYSLVVTGGFIKSTAGKCGIGFFNIQGAATSFHIADFQSGDPQVAATGITLTVPTVCATNVPTPSATGLDGQVCQPCSISFTPSGGVLASDFTPTFSDGHGGTFTGGTITAGQSSAIFRYTGASAGNRTITATDNTGNAFAQATGNTSVVDDVVLVDGNSLFSLNDGIHGVFAGMSVFLQTLFGANRPVFCYARSGNTTAQRTAAFPTAVAPTAALVRGRKLLVMMEWSNDFSETNPSPSTATAIAHVQAYVTQALAAGCVVILCTSTTRSPTSPYAKWFPDQGSTAANAAVLDAAIDTVNAAIRANYQAWGAKAVVEIRNDANMSDPTNVTYFFTDGTHYQPAGESRAATLIYNLLGTLSFSALARKWFPGLGRRRMGRAR